MCQRYGLSPQTVADMTPDQFAALAQYDPRPGALPPGKDARTARDEMRKRQGKQ